jgi:hypothetical protein
VVLRDIPEMPMEVAVLTYDTPEPVTVQIPPQARTLRVTTPPKKHP